MREIHELTARLWQKIAAESGRDYINLNRLSNYDEWTKAITFLLPPICLDPDKEKVADLLTESFPTLGDLSDFTIEYHSFQITENDKEMSPLLLRQSLLGAFTMSSNNAMANVLDFGPSLLDRLSSPELHAFGY